LLFSLIQDKRPMKLKLKDNLFEEVTHPKIPAFLNDIAKALPYKDYVHPDGNYEAEHMSPTDSHTQFQVCLTCYQNYLKIPNQTRVPNGEFSWMGRLFICLLALKK
jgi:hypothetical protein